MPKRINETSELQKHTLNLYAGDYARIQELFPEVGAGIVIRRLVRNFLDKEGLKSSVADTPKVEIDINV